ncbi:hypothetical protein R1flu_026228 [Riccia fluitans]|uniref:Light-mediated development protein DET1 n=1 Tax=Riccia fluitans TaxID=41844 RepID=A0ABD1XFC8_9MARC
MRTLGQVSVLGVEDRRKGMLKRSENIVHRLFSREISRARPNTHINKARELYENIVPSHTVYDVECPDHLIRKFTNDGQYLICFSRNHQELIVYRHRWFSYSGKGEESDQITDLPAKYKKFESYFVQLYSVSLASGNDVICKDFFLATDNSLYGLFATTSTPDPSPPAAEGAVPGVPSIEKIVIYLVRLSDGHIADERIYHDDFIHLSHNMGVFLYDDLLAVLSIRYQSIRILQIRDTGRFVDVRTIGTHCREDDELILNSQAQEEEIFLQNQAALRKARGLPARAEVSASKRLESQGNAWPLEWNLKLKQQASKVAHPIRNRGTRSANTQRTQSGMAPLASTSEAGGGRPDSTSNGIYEGIQGTDLDLQYAHYFRGLFTNMEENSVQTRDFSSGIASASDVQTTINPNIQDRRVNPTHHAVYENGYHSSGVETGDGFTRPEQVYRNAIAGIPVDASTSGSGGHHLASGLFHYGRTYSAANGDSGDRLTSRGSSSVRYPSTTGTSSESCGKSDDGSRWEGSVSGGSLSYGTGGGGSGSVSVQSADNIQMDFVLTSRSRINLSNGQHARPTEDAYLPSASHHRENGHRSAGNGWSAAGLPMTNDHRRTQGTAVLTSVTEGTLRSNDRFLPSRFANERATVGGERESPSIGSPSEPSVSRRDTAPHRDVVRAVQAIAPPAPRLVPQAVSNGVAQRNATESEPAPTQEGSSQLLGGMKQRLLSFMFKASWDLNLSPIEKAKMLKRFYYHFQHYEDLVMWKVQFLDRYHLLIKFGSIEGVHRSTDMSHQNAFLAVYNLETTEMLGFYQNTSEELLSYFENFCDHFRVVPRFPLHMNFISSYSNNIHLREQLRKQRVASSSSKSGSYAQVVRRTLGWLPFSSQCHSPSVYFDQSLFHYDEKLISAVERHKPCMEHPIKFISRRKPNSLKFKINPGSEEGSHDGRSKRVASFVFHPIFPFAISIQQSYMQPGSSLHPLPRDLCGSSATSMSLSMLILGIAYSAAVARDVRWLEVRGLVQTVPDSYFIYFIKTP